MPIQININQKIIDSGVNNDFIVYNGTTGKVKLQKHSNHIAGRSATPKNGQDLRSLSEGKNIFLKLCPTRTGYFKMEKLGNLEIETAVASNGGAMVSDTIKKTDRVRIASRKIRHW